MPRELLILRHGKSDWSMDVDDFHRPLKDRGKRSAQRIATWLAGQQLLPDYIISSPAERAIETARKAAKAMGLGNKDVNSERDVYLASLPDLLGVLEKCPAEPRRVMIVGHNPGLAELLQYLSNIPMPVPSDGKLLPTATLAVLEMPESWQRLPSRCAKVKKILRPTGLPDKFPFPLENSEELRDRPAYYYQQSSVIPFRETDHGIDILVILSSKKKHFVVPKGIHDPGLTAQESAAKEAWEEAGVDGEVLDEPLGTYSYDKWGAECTVTVFPMQVEHLVPEADWKESHRGREWVSAQRAQERLKQPALAPMIDELVRRYA